MATHKVPQDVEADDKLIGFLSLKQFIFTIVGLGFGYLTFFFFTKVHPVSALLWLPFALVFLVLGLYQRKDQPAEVFLLSALGFYLKPHVRIWSQDGYEERVMITAPPVIEKHYTKDFTGEEARGRLSNLSLMMDSRGWASKKTDDWQNPQLATIAAGSDRIMSAQDIASTQSFDPMRYGQPADPYDDRSIVGRQFEQKIVTADQSTHQQALQVMQQASTPTTQDSLSSGVSMNPVVTPQANTPVPTSVIPNNTITATTEPSQTPTRPASEPKESEPVAKDLPSELNVPHENSDGSVELKLH